MRDELPGARRDASALHPRGVRRYGIRATVCGPEAAYRPHPRRHDDVGVVVMVVMMVGVQQSLYKYILGQL